MHYVGTLQVLIPANKSTVGSLIIYTSFPRSTSIQWYIQYYILYTIVPICIDDVTIRTVTSSAYFFLTKEDTWGDGGDRRERDTKITIFK